MVLYDNCSVFLSGNFGEDYTIYYNMVTIFINFSIPLLIVSIGGLQHLYSIITQQVLHQKVFFEKKLRILLS